MHWNTFISHIPSGKAYDRAIRGHLVGAALNTLLAERILGTLSAYLFAG